jgi:hypothetical protein
MLRFKAADGENESDGAIRPLPVNVPDEANGADPSNLTLADEECGRDAAKDSDDGGGADFAKSRDFE